MAKLDFDKLIGRIAASRDREAFVTLFAFYAPRIKTFLMRRGAAADHAEDLAQDAMLKVWRKADQFDARRASASAWIFSIVRNLKIDDARRQARIRRLNETEEPPPAPPDISDDVILAEERDKRVRTALASLPPEQLQVVKLSFFEGRAHPEIAAQLDLPLGTVKSRLRLAFARLRGILDETDE